MSDFDDRFDRHFNRVDKALDNPGRTFLKLGATALILNLLFWGALIVMVVLAVKAIF